MKILIVDDHKEDRYMLEVLHRGHGYGVVSAANGAEALEKALSDNPDIIISDILMPRMDGFQLCRKVKTDKKLKKIAFVFYTATYTDPKDEEFALGLGAEKFIVKPTEPYVFIEILKQVIRSHKTRALPPPKPPVKEEVVYLKEYNERLIKKLEDKILQLESVSKALKGSEKKYRDLIDNANDVIIVIEPTGYFSFVNLMFCEMTGYSMKEAKKLHFTKLIHPDDSAIVNENFERVLAGGTIPKNYEFRVLTKSGEVLYAELNATPINKEEEIVGIEAIVRDTTERKRTEEALWEASEKRKELEAIVNQSPAVVFLWIAVKGWPVEFVSDNVQQFGYTPEDFYSRRILFADIVHPDDREQVAAEVTRYSKEGREDFVQEYRIITKSDEVCWLDDRTWARRNSKGVITHYQGIVLDVTKRKRAEEEKIKIQAQLLQAQKMEAIGTLAGGVAHDFNNMLTAIQGYTDLAMMEIDETDPLYRDLKQIHRAAVRAADLTRQLLLFSRKRPMEFTLLNINRMVEDLLKMLDRLISEDIVINTDPQPDIWTVRCDAGNIEQVIMNLAVNARDAMPDGGKLTIKTKNITLDEEDCKLIHEARPGKFICLSVEDTGAGMDKDVIQHIFEPFFSTKETEKGTGLGLSVVYGIVKQHEGWINVYSEPGKGSMFKVYLPAFSVKLEDGTNEAISLQELQGSGERILLVEDEEGVRDFGMRALGENGYMVFEAANAKEAMESFEKEKGNFHLVFCDVVLPDKSGPQLVEQLLSRKPELLVLLSSGYTDDKSQWSMIYERGFRFLQKPYALDDLLRTIKEVIKHAK